MKKYKIIILFVLSLIILISILVTLIISNNKTFLINNCADNNIDFYIRQAIKEKYPILHLVVSHENGFHESRGDYLLLKIITFKGFQSEIFKCGEIYHESQCNLSYLKKYNFYTDNENENYDIIRLNNCYYDLATFYNNTEICYNIQEKETQEHCFNFFTK